MPAVVVPIVAGVISAVLPASIAGATIFGVSVATIAATTIVTGALVGASILLMPHRQRQSGQLPQAPPSTTAMSRASPVEARFYGFGRVSDGGATIFFEVQGAGWLGQAIVVDCGAIDGIDAVYCDNEMLPLVSGAVPVPSNYGTGIVTTMRSMDFADAAIRWPNGGIKSLLRYSDWWNGFVLTKIPIGYSPGVITEFRNAATPGTPSKLLRAFFGDDPGNLAGSIGLSQNIGWGSTHRCDGLSVLYTAACKFQAVDKFGGFPEVFPRWRVVSRRAKVFDPRDVTQSFADPTTWKWSRNPALCRAWHATHTDGLRRTYAEIDWDSIAAAANYCDRVVATYGAGTEVFARCDLQWHTAEERRDVEARIDATCDGVGYEDENGLFVYRIRQAETPTVTFTMADISSIIEDHAGGPYAAATAYVGVYVEPRANYQNTEAPPVVDTAAEAVIGHHPTQLQLDGVQSFNQAYRIAHRVMRRANPKRKLTLVGGWSFLTARRERVIRLECSEVGVVGDFWIDGPMKFDTKLARWVLNVAEIESDAFDDVVPPRDPISPDASAVVITPTEVETPSTPLLSQSGSAPSASIVGSVSEPSNGSLTVHFQYSDDSFATYSPMDTIIDQWTRSGGTLDVGTYQVRAWFTAQDGTAGQFSATASITIV